MTHTHTLGRILREQGNLPDSGLAREAVFLNLLNPFPTHQPDTIPTKRAPDERCKGGKALRRWHSMASCAVPSCSQCVHDRVHATYFLHAPMLSVGSLRALVNPTTPAHSLITPLLDLGRLSSFPIHHRG
jgi:hypothetical protein